MERGALLKLFIGVVGVFAIAGCQANRKPIVMPATMPGLSPPAFVESINVTCSVPADWQPQPLKSGPLHSHETWVSPSGKTAYGVIHFTLPLPVSPGLLLWAFLDEMKRQDGRADLLERRDDPDLPGVRFVAVGNKYTVHTNLMSRGFEAWAVYVGTLTDQSVAPDELPLAERARETTILGKAEIKQ